MRTRKEELISDELKPLVTKIMREGREKYNYSLEDLAKAIQNIKNRQTLHKYETGTLNIPYRVFFEICRIFNIENIDLDSMNLNPENKEKYEKKLVKDYINSLQSDRNITKKIERTISTYKNAVYEPITNNSELAIKVVDDSMAPNYLKNDKLFFKKQENYQNGDDIIIAVKNNILAVRRLYKYPKGIILQALNPKYQTINVNIVSNEMILGRVVGISREIK